MGLWLEHRDEKGNLLDRAQFRNGSVTLADTASFSLKDALALVKPSSHFPLDKREWALRISFDDASV